MKRTALGLLCLYIALLCGCEKNSCQTFLQGSWIVKYPKDSAMLSIDSVTFFGGDSLTEKYKLRAGANDTFRYMTNTYFITDNCAEVDFNGSNTWTAANSSPKFNIILVTPYDFEFRNKADSNGCDSCIVAFYR